MLNYSDQVIEKLLSDMRSLDYTGYAEQFPLFGSWGAAGLSRKTIQTAWKAALRQSSKAGLYVAIPFCRSKCNFCFLPVIPIGGEAAAARKYFKAYFGLLEKEARLFSAVFSRAPFSTLYIGGGTPSLMTTDEIHRLFALLRSNFSFRRNAQLATEIHPETAALPLLQAFKAGGLNWLSIGAQSLDSKVLSGTRRSQDRLSVIRAYENARRAGIAGVNIDLICGLPGQTEKNFLEDVRTLAELRPDEIHLNTFIVTPHTIYGRCGGRAPDEKLTERLKEKGFSLLAAKGYLKRSDSAGLPGASSNLQTTNLKQKGSLLGLGPGALSHAWGSARYINHISWAGYKDELSKALPPAQRSCLITKKDEMVYYVLEALSMEPHVLELSAFRAAFGADARAVFKEELRLLKAGGVREVKGALRAGPEHWSLLRKTFYSPGMFLNLAAGAAHRNAAGA